MSERRVKKWLWSVVSVFGVFAVMSLIVAGRTAEKIEATEVRSKKNSEAIIQDRSQHHQDILYIRENMITKQDLRDFIQYYERRD